MSRKLLRFLIKPIIPKICGSSQINIFECLWRKNFFNSKNFLNLFISPCYLWLGRLTTKAIKTGIILLIVGVKYKFHLFQKRFLISQLFSLCYLRSKNLKSELNWLLILKQNVSLILPYRSHGRIRQMFHPFFRG